MKNSPRFMTYVLANISRIPKKTKASQEETEKLLNRLKKALQSIEIG